MAHALEGDIRRYIEDPEATDLVRRYFAPSEQTDSGLAYSGARFDTFGGGGDAADTCDRFTSDDLVALSFLAVSVPGHAASAVLERKRHMLNGLLAEIPADVDLWAADESVIADDSPAAKLFHELDSLDGVGWVTAHKLLARKRPRLLPVYDSVVEAALQPNQRAYWRPLRTDLQQDGVVKQLGKIRSAANVDESISLLRILDIVIWMRERGVQQSVDG